MQCPKCEATFADEKTLEQHSRRKKGSCIGAWYVCKRCTRFFGHQSELERHQAAVKPCLLYPTAPMQPEIPKEVSAWIRYEKAIRDNLSTRNYLERVVRRRCVPELMNVLEACSVADDLPILLELVSALNGEDTGGFLKILGTLSDFANGETTSLEKRTVLQEYVNKNVTI
jgi:uncharacterized C2H2 Zn-finger protein